MLPTLGIDISKDSFHLELSINDKLRHRKFANRKEGFGELCAWLAKHKAIYVHACLEATGPYSEALAIYLHEQGHIVSVVNPVQIKAFGQSELLRNKDDRPDAGLIRRFCEKQRPAPWTPPPPHLRELQALTRHLENLIETRQQQINRLEATNTKNVAKPDYQRPVTPECERRSSFRRSSPNDIIRSSGLSVSAWLAMAKTKCRSSAPPCANFSTSLSVC